MAKSKKGTGAVAAIKKNVAQSVNKRGAKPATKTTNSGTSVDKRIGRGGDGNYDY